MRFRVIAITGKEPPDAAYPMGKQGSEPPDHFIRRIRIASFF